MKRKKYHSKISIHSIDSALNLKPDLSIKEPMVLVSEHKKNLYALSPPDPPVLLLPSTSYVFSSLLNHSLLHNENASSAVLPLSKNIFTLRLPFLCQPVLTAPLEKKTSKKMPVMPGSFYHKKEKSKKKESIIPSDKVCRRLF
jgi:hypothetical protein